MVFPKPRNALDMNLAPWQDWGYPCDATHQGPQCAITFCTDGKNCEGSCPVSARDGTTGHLAASNGQACYWFSNGCTVGCEECDGTTNHPGRGNQRWRWRGLSGKELRSKNLTINNPWSPKAGEMVLDPNTTKGLVAGSTCDKPTMGATICDPELRTLNTQAECGSPEDYTYYSPWRAPGAAPVLDACGVAGGRFPGQGIGPGGAQYQNTSLARQSDLGSALPPMESQATWKAGSNVEVGWTVMANHGGGYAYRLAPADAPLTEETFRKIPLDFVGKSALRWDGDASTQLEFDAWQVEVGTVPQGSAFRKNPIPTVLWEREGPSFQPVCEESDECRRYASGYGGDFGACRCSGHSNGGPLLPNLVVVDSIRIPKDLPRGRYVLQWRWDCEESSQVWASCSDVTVA